MYAPFCARVARNVRISPNIHRVTFTGVDRMGPPKVIRDLRIKLIIPGKAGLPALPNAHDWYAAWRSLPSENRGVMRTYSVRDLRRPDQTESTADADGPPQQAELDIDFVIHADGHGRSGPASDWAQSAKPGDEIIVIAPTEDDDSGAGIEFTPGTSRSAELYGDETAMPAIAKILSEWPENLPGSAHIEVPTDADRQNLLIPSGVTVHWHARDRARAGSGELLRRALEESAAGSSRTPAAAQKPDLPTPDKPTEPCGESDGLVWETPLFSTSGEAVSDGVPAEDCETYFWIAGESSAVVAMRRLLVREHGVPRQRVSFMGYWKKDMAHRG